MARYGLMAPASQRQWITRAGNITVQVSAPIVRQSSVCAAVSMRVWRLANFTLKLVRPGFGRQTSCLPRREHDGVTAVAVRHSVLRTSGNRRAAPASARGTGRTA